MASFTITNEPTPDGEGKRTTTYRPAVASVGASVQFIPEYVQPQGRVEYGDTVRDAPTEDDRIVRVNGVQMTARQAIEAGVLKRDDAGKLTDAPQPTPEAKPEAQPEEQPQAFTPEDEQATALLVQQVLPGDVAAAVAHIREGREVPAEVIARAAAFVGVEPSEMQALAEKVQGAYQAQAVARVERYGVDADEVWQHALAHNPAALREAIETHTSTRSTKGYDALAADYVASLDKLDPEAILTADLGPGVSVSRHPITKQITVSGPGFTTPWSVAIRQGLIKTSRRAR